MLDVVMKEMEDIIGTSAPRFESREPSRRSVRQFLEFVYESALNWWNPRRYKWRSQYNCPVCGDFPDDDYPSDTLLWLSGSWQDYEGGNNWDEKHQCARCGTVFEFCNGDR